MKTIRAEGMETNPKSRRATRVSGHQRYVKVKEEVRYKEGGG